MNVAEMSPPPASASTQPPCGDLHGLVRSFKNDVVAGFLVFLIALPLCLGIASASGFPAIAGVFTAIIGGIVAALVSNSELTIKGPAAGLIVIVFGCIKDFGGDGNIDGWTAADQQAYQLALGVAVAAAVLQMAIAVFRSGVLGEFFPMAVIHGMLSAIGIIIIAKQFPVALGVEAKGEPLELLMSIPEKISHLNPEVAAIGAVSLLILFGMPLIRWRYARLIPAQMIVVLVAIPLGMWFDLDHPHAYTFTWPGMDESTYQINPNIHEVNVPANMFQAIVLPDFSGLMEPKAWKWVVMFAIIGSLESILSAKAIDSLDPWRRKTNLDRDTLAVGLGNLASALVGGLPMISEIVRSKANIDNGARTRFANLYHGLFLLAFVATVPWLIHRIPTAALGAMLVYTGSRLASPREFVGVYRVGREQFVVFCATLIGVIAIDLLVGIGIGIAVKFAIHLWNYAPVRSLFICDVDFEQPDEKSVVVRVRNAAVFSNWISLKRRLMHLDSRLDVYIDLSEAHLVDHTVMEQLHELEKEFAANQRKLQLVGLDNHAAMSSHPYATRKLIGGRKSLTASDSVRISAP